MKRILLFAAILFLAIAGVIGLDIFHGKSLRPRAQAIKVGDSRQRVEQVLGRPIVVFTPPSEGTKGLVIVRPETWAYGRRLQLRDAFYGEFPYFRPLRVRLFGPDDDDVAIEFDASGKVSSVSIPIIS